MQVIKENKGWTNSKRFKRKNQIVNKKKYNIYLSSQRLREFYAVVTNKKYLKNPLSPIGAKNQIEFFKQNFNILIIDDDTITKLLKLAEKYSFIKEDKRILKYFQYMPEAPRVTGRNAKPFPLVTCGASRYNY